MIEDFLNYLKYERNFSDNTILSYRKPLKDFSSYLDENNLNFANVPYGSVRKYIQLLYEKKINVSTLSHHISVLKSFYKYLNSEKNITNNPMVLISCPKKEKKLPVYLKYEELEKLFDSVEDGPCAIRDILILEMLYSTGVRISELINIKLNDISFEERKILILGKGRKEREVYFGERCLSLLYSYLEDFRKKYCTLKNDFLFINEKGEQITDNCVRKSLADILKKSNLKINVTPHTLRHTFATHMLDEGADLKTVSDLLGHENLSTTTIYTHLSNEHLRKVYLSSHPRAKKH